MTTSPDPRRGRRFLGRTDAPADVRPSRRPVAVPSTVTGTEAVFLLLRRLRPPLILLAVIFAISVTGLTLIPGQDEAGNPERMGVFEAFYFISYTATTIGFGEIRDFTVAQRMWVTFSIYLTVIGWAYAIGTSLDLMRDASVRRAVAINRFGRRVRRLREDFVLIAGYGAAGRRVVRELDRAGYRVVVVDVDPDQIDRLGGAPLYADVPALAADAALPGVLGLAGLGSPHCTAVLALTDDDDTNLAVVMSGALLRPELPVVARCQDLTTEDRMREFSAHAVINPADRYGGYLVLAMERPATYRLVTRLMAEDDEDVEPHPRTRTGHGRWVVIGDSDFTTEIAADLRSAGMTVDATDSTTDIDVGDAHGVVVGTDNDTLNLAIAERARNDNPDIFLALRQRTGDYRALVDALHVDSVYTPTGVVAQEALARVVTPVLWQFLDHVLDQDDAWAQAVLTRLEACCGRHPPERRMITLSARTTPAVDRWLRHSPLTVGELLRHPDDRDTPLAAVPLVVIRRGALHHLPDASFGLRRGDQILLAGSPEALSTLAQVLDYDSIVEYVVTGHHIPDSWLWRRLTRDHGLNETLAPRTDDDEEGGATAVTAVTDPDQARARRNTGTSGDDDSGTNR